MVICGGAWSGEIGRRLGLEDKNELNVFGTPIPIEPRYIIFKYF